MRSSKLEVQKSKRKPQASRLKPKRIAIVTGTRAEFGLLQTVMRAVDEHRALSLHVIAAGMHLVNDTQKDIRAAGFDIMARVRMQKSDETGRSADVQAVSRGIAGFGKAFDKIKPDMIVVLGDRIEVMAAALAAQVGGYRIAHMHGGDRAEGVADEAMRHAISKLAHLHLSATQQSRQRLIRLGEDWQHTICVGSPAMDGLRDVQPADDAPEVIVLQHPVGSSDAVEKKWMTGTLHATRKFKPLVMAPNHDPGSKGVRAALRGTKSKVTTHLNRADWLQQLAGAKVIVGNSSAGLIEAAALKTACVNVGPRQNGREKPAHVIDCDYGERNVRAAIEQAMKLNLSRSRHPYGNGQTGQRVAELLATLDLNAIPLRKRNTY